MMVPHTGGIHQYSLTMLQALKGLMSDGSQDQFLLLTEEYNVQHPGVASFSARGRSVMPLVPPKHFPWPVSALDQIVGDGPHREARCWLRRRIQRNQQHPSPPPAARQDRKAQPCARATSAAST